MVRALRLLDLKPEFIRYEERVETWARVLGDPATWKSGDPTEQVTGPRGYLVMCSFEEADGVMFLCPKCLAAQPDGIGVHSCICWCPRVPPHVAPKPGRWEFVGTGFDDLSLVAGSSSVALQGGCAAHFFVEHGSIRMC